MRTVRAFRSTFIAMLLVGVGCSQSSQHLQRAEEAAARGMQLVDEARALARSNPDTANERFGQAEASLVEARLAYLRARADESADPEVLIAFADVAEALSDFDLAGESLYRAARLRGSDAALWYRAGRNFVDAGGSYLADAGEALDRAWRLTQVPDSELAADVRVAQGELFWKRGMHRAAHDEFVVANAAEMPPVRAQLALIGSTLATGDVVGAQALLDSIDDPEVLATPFANRILREAYLVNRAARGAGPDGPEAWVALSKIAVRLGFLEDGRLAVERAIVLGSEDTVALNLAGSLAVQAGDTERARALFARSLELDPDQPRTRDALRQLGGESIPN